MNKKIKREYEYVCTLCDAKYAKWSGQCSSCMEWNCIEHTIPKSHELNTATSLNLAALSTQPIVRICTSIKEFNYVTGGGLVPGSVILIGGEPGIGKSTLLLQLCDSLPASTNKPLYISGEEAASQVALRAARLKIDVSKFNAAFGTDLEQIYALLQECNPNLVIIDSIQTMHYKQSDAGAGTAGQIRACATLLTEWAKNNNVCVILVGHITKEGSLAGPKLLEHMVDAVLYFEGERSNSCRLLRCVKNRFGATDEVGIFEMQQEGLKEVANPSQFFLSNHSNNSSGVVVFPSLEGTRPVLVELQALTLQSHIQIPRRAVVGWDHTRLSMIAAVIETKLKIRLSQKEIYINVVGGMKINDPGADLAVAMALLSSHYNIPIPSKLVIFGEIGLSGEVRSVGRAQARLKEAARIGIEHALVPHDIICTDLKQALKITNCKTIEDARAWLQNRL